MATKKKKTSKPRQVSIHCNNCNHETVHTVIAENVETLNGEERIGTQIFEFWSENHAEILRCGCGELALKSYYYWSEDAPDFPETGVQIEPKRGVASIAPLTSFKYVPKHIGELYQELIDGFIAGCNLLCAGGIRAILEAICIDKNIKEGTVPGTPPKLTKSLQGKIYGLYENGFITKRHAQILTHHQYLGDKALHELKIPVKGELELAIEIIAHTLSSIYELDIKAAELKKREGQRKFN